jgi:hypothetical protein
MATLTNTSGGTASSAERGEHSRHDERDTGHEDHQGGGGLQPPQVLFVPGSARPRPEAVARAALHGDTDMPEHFYASARSTSAEPRATGIGPPEHRLPR